MSNWALVTAAGAGHRFGGPQPKQFVEVAGRPLLYHVLLPFLTHRAIRGAVLTLPEKEQARVKEWLRDWGWSHKVKVVAGGMLRQDSVMNGLAAVPKDCHTVLVHDGSRPCLAAALLDRLLEEAARHEAVIPALPVRETMKRVDEARVLETVPREGLWLVQTPQLFRPALLKQAMEEGLRARFVGTDEASFVERLRHPIAVVAGDPWNIKVTYPEDLALVRAWLKEQAMAAETSSRVGQGFDVHALVEGRELWLGGVKIDFPKGLLGHSDADVLTHALCDAVLGAACLGDIGRHCPDTDPKWKGASGEAIAGAVMRKVREAGYRVLHLDATVVCQAPKIAPHAPAIVVNLSRWFGVDPAAVNVKGKSTEELGFTGRGEGIAALAVATLLRETPPAHR